MENSLDLDDSLNDLLDDSLHILLDESLDDLLDIFAGYICWMIYWRTCWMVRWMICWMVRWMICWIYLFDDSLGNLLDVFVGCPVGYFWLDVLFDTAVGWFDEHFLPNDWLRYLLDAGVFFIHRVIVIPVWGHLLGYVCFAVDSFTHKLLRFHVYCWTVTCFTIHIYWIRISRFQ